MILTCEKCHTRYLLPSHSLAPDGRRVRCSNCGHEWDQDYEEDEFIGDDADGDEGVEPIPEAVRPIPEGSDVPSLAVREEAEKPFPAGSILAAAGVFVVILVVLVMLRTPITNAWPQSGVFYQLIGMEPDLPGEGLIFDGLKATSDDVETGGLAIDLTGNIVNLSGAKADVPLVRFTLNDAAGEAVESWFWVPEQQVIEPHGEMAFHTSRETAAKDTQGVTVGFTLTGVVVDDMDDDSEAADMTVEDPVEPAPVEPAHNDPAHDPHNTGEHH